MRFATINFHTVNRVGPSSEHGRVNNISFVVIICLVPRDNLESQVRLSTVGLLAFGAYPAGDIS